MARFKKELTTIKTCRKIFLTRSFDQSNSAARKLIIKTNSYSNNHNKNLSISMYVQNYNKCAKTKIEFNLIAN